MNPAAIYGEATNPRLKEIYDRIDNKEESQFADQKFAVHSQWINLQYTQDYLQKLRNEIDQLENELEQHVLANISPDRYFILKDKLQKRFLLKQVVRLATEGNNKLNDSEKTDKK